MVAVARRRILQTLVASMAVAAHTGALASPAHRIEAVAFDAFPIFDPRSVASMAESLFPGHGPALMAAWRTRQFDYAWLSSLVERYQDFLTLTDTALVAAAADLKLDLTPDARKQLLRAYLSLKAWPDVPPILKTLKSAGIKLAILSNLSPTMLDGCLASSGLKGLFDQVLSTDRVKTYKPAPRAYQLGVDALRMPKQRIAFVAFADWDAFGAKSFGYPTFWNNRAGQVPEGLGAPPDAESSSLGDLLKFVGSA